jgi:methionyl aminopeptidase
MKLRKLLMSRSDIMINIKTPDEIELMRVAGKIVGDTHNHLIPYLRPGITTKELDNLAYQFITKAGATPSFKNYGGFPGSICASVNEQVVHGIPSNRALKEGDIISIDIGAKYHGYHGDSAWTYPIGKVSADKEYLMKHTLESLYKGLEVVKEGNRIGDIGYAIESYANMYKLGVVKELVGHGVGSELHEAPDIPNYGKPNTGPILKAGMVLAIEPMLNMGTAKVFMLDDDWTIITADNKPSAHYEHTVLVTKDGYEILTKR